MRIRPATIHDAAAIATIQVNSWRAAYRGLMPQPVLDSLSVEQRAGFWEKLLSDEHRTVVADSQAGPIGFCSVIPARDGAARVAEIAAIYVLPGHWRQGAGRALCAAAFESAASDGFSAIILWVLANNTRALSFYTAQGFVRDGREREEALPDGTLIPELGLHRSLP